MKTSLLCAIAFLVPYLSRGDDTFIVTYPFNNPNGLRTVRQIDCGKACRIETAGGKLRLLREQDGKLLPYFKTSDTQPAKVFLMLLQQAQDKELSEGQKPRFASVGGGAYVVLKNVVQADLVKGDGKERCILRGFKVEFGRTDDPAVVERVKKDLDDVSTLWSSGHHIPQN
jgi:hypothetical protein